MHPALEAVVMAALAKDPAQRWQSAEEAIVRVFGKGRKDVAAREVKDLSRTLERALGPRKEWDLELSRRLADLLLADPKARLRSSSGASRGKGWTATPTRPASAPSTVWRSSLWAHASRT